MYINIIHILEKPSQRIFNILLKKLNRYYYKYNNTYTLQPINLLIFFFKFNKINLIFRIVLTNLSN